MPQRSYFVRVILSFLPFAVVIAALAGFGYFTFMHSYKEAATEAQLQIAHHAAQALSRGAQPQEVLPSGSPVAIETSEAPYVIIYNRTGTPIAGSGSLHGSAPVLPVSVLAAAQEFGENSLTWEPEEGVRQGIVVVPYSNASAGGYVMAGRSLAEAERQEGSLSFMILFATAAAFALSFVAVMLREWLA